jgi:hypothetical protein
MMSGWTSGRVDMVAAFFLAFLTSQPLHSAAGSAKLALLSQCL